MDSARKILDRAMSEEDLEDTVAEIAVRLGYMVFHPNKATIKGRKGEPVWLTAYKGNKGFPDWVFARNGKVLFVEFKKEGRYPSPHQREWLRELGPLARVWRPSDLSSGEIMRTLVEL